MVLLVEPELADHGSDLVLPRDLQLHIVLKAFVPAEHRRLLPVRLPGLAVPAARRRAADARESEGHDARLLGYEYLETRAIDHVLHDALVAPRALEHGEHLLGLRLRAALTDVVDVASGGGDIPVQTLLVTRSSGLRLQEVIVVERAVLVVPPVLHNRCKAVGYERNRHVVGPLTHGREHALALARAVGKGADVVDANSDLAANEARAQELASLIRVGLVLLVTAPELGRADAREGDAVLHRGHREVLDHHEVAADYLNNTPRVLGRGGRCSRALRGDVVLPNAQPALLGEALTLVELLSVARELGRPVDNLSEAHLEELDRDVAHGMHDGAVEVVVLVHTLEKHLDLPVEELMLNEVARLHSEGVRNVRLALGLRTLEARAGDTREEHGDPAKRGQHEAAERRPVAQLLDQERLRHPLARLEDLLGVVVAGGDDLPDSGGARAGFLGPHAEPSSLSRGLEP
mmetsp:Transcript_23770/g.58718  ORF Transcript_23770/g.58718 Transcript_23770/m.58718 type:complete len:462 (-) Transcript_23770:288-1673(-)